MMMYNWLAGVQFLEFMVFRLGATSDVREVEKQRLNAVSLEEAQDKYAEVAGELAADTLRVAHQNQNRGRENWSHGRP